MNLFHWPNLARVSSCSLVVEHQPGQVTRITVIGSTPARSTQIFFYLVACLGLSRNGLQPVAIMRDRVVGCLLGHFSLSTEVLSFVWRPL